MIVEPLVALLIVVGALFTFVGSLGLARFPDIYTRLHGPTKATTLGVGALIVASVLYFSAANGGVNFHEILIAIFLFLTAPVSAHLVARAALVRKLDSVTAGSSTGHGHRRPDEEPGADQPRKVETPPPPPED